MTGIQTDIIYNNNSVGRVEVYIDFPGIRATAQRFQLAAFVFILLSGAAIYFLPTRTVRTLESSLVKLNCELETKVRERTDQLGKSNDELKKELATRKKLEASLIQAGKMSAVGQLAAGVAHKINNPLGVILGFSQSALGKIKDSDTLFLPIKSIVRESLRCQKLVQSLLAFSRQTNPLMKKISLDDTLSSALCLIEAQARIKSVEIVRELGSPPPLMGDMNQIQQVILNLCNNAIDAMPHGGRITARTSVTEDKRGIVLEIEDTGSGIPADIGDKIFDPFFTTKEVGKGAGLGLSLAYEIMQKHHGTINLKSKVGQGTTFTLRFRACGHEEG
jgi:signal transduction histidine kinase